MYHIDAPDTESTVMQEATLIPKLQYASDLLSNIIEDLGKLHREATRISKRRAAKQEGIGSNSLVCAVTNERLVALAFESTYLSHLKLCRLEMISSISRVIPSIIPVIRAASSQSYTVAPHSSASLCEVAAILGSVAMDAALMAKTSIDYELRVEQSDRTLKHVKSIVDSKLSELYPKLDLTRLGSTWA